MSTPPWAQRIHAVLFHQGAPALGEGMLRSGPRAWPRCPRAAAAAHLSPAGQLQIATALDMTDAPGGPAAWSSGAGYQMPPRHLAGAKVLASRLYGVGPFAARWR